jgi:hypothetical protein
MILAGSPFPVGVDSCPFQDPNNGAEKFCAALRPRYEIAVGFVNAFHVPEVEV